MRKTVQALVQNPLHLSAAYFSLAGFYLLGMAHDRFICGIMQKPMFVVGTLCVGLAVIALLQCRKPFAPMTQNVFSTQQNLTIRTIGLFLPALFAIFTLLPFDCMSPSKLGPSMILRAISPELRVPTAELRTRILQHAEKVTEHLFVAPSSPNYEPSMIALLSGKEVSYGLRKHLQDHHGYPKTLTEIQNDKADSFEHFRIETVSSRIRGLDELGMVRVTVDILVFDDTDKGPTRLSIPYKIGLRARTQEAVVVEIENCHES